MFKSPKSRSSTSEHVIVFSLTFVYIITSGRLAVIKEDHMHACVQ